MRSRSPGKRTGVVLDSGGVGERDVNQSHGFFRRAAAGSGDAGDADAEGRAGAPANAGGQRLRDLRADRALALR